MRIIYSFLLYLLTPAILLYLKRRGKKNPEYLLHWQERFAFKLTNPCLKPIIWIHAVSVGETRAINKLIYLLQQNYPQYDLLLTQMTPTGRKTATELYKNIFVHYLPYDMPHAINNFYKTFKPKIGLIVETEIWPNLLHYGKKYNTPISLVNARLSDKSFKSYAKIKLLMRGILNNFNAILCQDQATLNNFKNLGYSKNLEIIGNIKFDIDINKDKLHLKNHLIPTIKDKMIIIFASTRDGEEKLIIENMPINNKYLIIIVPRHPERFAIVEQLLIEHNIVYQRRSDNNSININTQVLLGDSMGEMLDYYNLSDIAVIGGSFADCGSQNLIEPIYMNKPVIVGPSIYNFTQIVNDALNDNCAIQVNNIQQCYIQIEKLINNKDFYTTIANNCTVFINKYTGASAKIINYLKNIL